MSWAQHTKLKQSFFPQTAADGSGGASGGHLAQAGPPTVAAVFLCLDRWGALLCSPSAQLPAN